MENPVEGTDSGTGNTATIGQLGRLAAGCLKRAQRKVDHRSKIVAGQNADGADKEDIGHTLDDSQVKSGSIETVTIDCVMRGSKDGPSELDNLAEIATANDSEYNMQCSSDGEEESNDDEDDKAPRSSIPTQEQPSSIKTPIPRISQTPIRQSIFSAVTAASDAQMGGKLLHAHNHHSASSSSSNSQNDQRARFVASWLLAEFEPCPASTLPRSTLYDRYQEVCEEIQMEPVNAATFGKIIRAVFTHLRTRRLGTRGNSKYHYEGIRAREGSAVASVLEASGISTTISSEAVVDNSTTTGQAILQNSTNDPKITNIMINTGRRKSLEGPNGRRGTSSLRPATLPKIAMNNAGRTGSGKTLASLGGTTTATGIVQQSPSSPMKCLAERPGEPPKTASTSNPASSSNTSSSSSSSFDQPPPSPAWAPLVPNYEEFTRHLEQRCLPNLANTPHGLPLDQLQTFAYIYQQHTIDMLRRIVSGGSENGGSSHQAANPAADLEATLQRFWQGQILTSTEYLACLHTEEGIRMVLIADDYLYQVAADVLIRDVLESIPIQVTQSIRQFAKAFEATIAALFNPATTANHIPLTLIRVKRDLAGRFGQVLRRRTSLNHLAQAVRSVLRNPDHSGQMSYDWMHIDFGGIRDQTAWILVPGDPFLVCIETGFKSYLTDGAALPQWTQWLENIIDQSIVMEMTSGETMDTAVRSIIMRWSFICSMIIRDLTLRSANSFGSFHLLRLFIDEYILFHLERKLDAHRRAVGMLGSGGLGMISTGPPPMGAFMGASPGGGYMTAAAHSTGTSVMLMAQNPNASNMLWASGLCDFEGASRQATAGAVGAGGGYSPSPTSSYNPQQPRYPMAYHGQQFHPQQHLHGDYSQITSYYGDGSGDSRPSMIADSASTASIPNNNQDATAIDEYYRKNYSFFGSHGTVVLGPSASTATDEGKDGGDVNDVPVMAINHESSGQEDGVKCTNNALSAATTLTTILNNS